MILTANRLRALQRRYNGWADLAPTLPVRHVPNIVTRAQFRRLSQHYSWPTAPNRFSGLDGWWKADGTLWQNSTRTTLAVADDDPVGACDDASGNGRHLVQATAGLRPLYKTGIQNGLPVIRFDGIDDRLLVTATSVSAWTVFVVANITSKINYTGPFQWWNGTGDGLKLVSDSSTTEYMRRLALYTGGSEEANNYINNTALTLPTGAKLWTWRRSSAAAPTLRQDGSAVALVTTTNGFAGAVGGIVNYDGTAGPGMDACEVILFNRALTDTERIAVERYLGQKWDIVVP